MVIRQEKYCPSLPICRRRNLEFELKQLPHRKDQSMKHASIGSMAGRIVAGLYLLSAVGTAHATIFVYDASRYGTLPTSQGWTLAGSQNGSQTIVNGALS